MSIIKKLASQTAIYGLSTMVGRFLNYLMVPVYTHYLGQVEDYGVVSVMFGYASLFSVLFALGLETAFFHFAQKTDKPENVFSTSSHTLIITGLVWILLAKFYAPEIMNWAGYPEHPEFAVWFVVILAVDAVTAIGFAWLRNQQRPWKFASIKLSNIFINIFFNLFFLIACPFLAKHNQEWAKRWSQPEFMVSAIFISNLIASLATFPLLFRTWKNLIYGLDFNLLKKMLKYSYPLVFVGLAGMINETFDRVLLKHLLPADIADYQTAIYSAFYKLSLVLTLFVQAFRFSAEPFFFQQAKSLNAQEMYAYVMKWFVYAVSIIYLLTIVFLPYIAPLLIRNPEYFKNPQGMMIVPVLLAANLCLGIYYTLSVWYKVSGQTLIGTIPAFIGAGLTLILNAVLIPKIGFVGSAYTTLIAYGSMVIIGYVLCLKYYPIPYKLFPILGSIILAIGMGFAIQQLQSSRFHIVSELGSIFILISFIYLYEKFKKQSKNHESA